MVEIINDTFWVDPTSVCAVYRSGNGETVVRFIDGEAMVVSSADVVYDVVERLAGPRLGG